MEDNATPAEDTNEEKHAGDGGPRRYSLMSKKVCVVGAGHWGTNHVKTLHGLGCLAGIVESDDATLRRFRDLYPGTATFANIREAIDAGFDGLPWPRRPIRTSKSRGSSSSTGSTCWSRSRWP